MRSRSRHHALTSLISLCVGAGGCALVLGLDEFADQPPSSTENGGAGGSGGDEGGEGGAGGESLECTPDASEACYAGPPSTRGVGACKKGRRTCTADGTWGACEGEVLPAVERCDAEGDENCDGRECILWAVAFDSTFWVPLDAIKSDAAGNAFVSATFEGTLTVGTTTFSSAGATDILLLKLSPSGEVLWAKQFGDASADNSWGLAVDSKGNVVIAGLTDSGATDFGDGPLPPGPFLVKLDPSGGLVWSKGLGRRTSNNRFKAVTIDSNDDVVVVGEISEPIDFGAGAISPPDGGTDLVVAKLDGSTGAVTAPGCWARTLGSAVRDSATAVAMDSSNNIFVLGSFGWTVDFGTAEPNEINHFVVKLTPGGSFAWAAALHPAGSVTPTDMIVDRSGRPVVVGDFMNNLHLSDRTLEATDSYDAFVVQFAANGTVRWARAFGGDRVQRAHGIARDTAGNLIIVGSAEEEIDLGGGRLSTNDDNAFVAKLTPDAELVWSRLMGGASGGAHATATTPDGETLVLGTTSASAVDFDAGPLPAPSDGTRTRLFVAKLGR